MCSGGGGAGAARCECGDDSAAAWLGEAAAEETADGTLSMLPTLARPLLPMLLLLLLLSTLASS
jgi:hypothetical protein